VFVEKQEAAMTTPPDKPYTEPISIRFDREMYERFKVIAKREDRTVASLIRHLVRQRVEADSP
jgi:predicted DNA-binding protein